MPAWGMSDVRYRVLFRPDPCKYQDPQRVRPHRPPRVSHVTRWPEVARPMSFNSMRLPETAPPPRAWRIRVSLAAALIAGVFVMIFYARQPPGVISDWDPAWVGTKALLRG